MAIETVAIAAEAGSAVLGKAIGTASQLYSINAQGHTLQGSVEQSANLFKLGQLGVFMYDVECSREDAVRIDNFLTRFGYAQNRIMPPNPTARPYYTFLQTADDCYTNGSNGRANTTEQQKINKILQQGVTFWRSSITSSNIFDYQNLNNSPS